MMNGIIPVLLLIGMAFMLAIVGIIDMAGDKGDKLDAYNAVMELCEKELPRHQKCEITARVIKE